MNEKIAGFVLMGLIIISSLGFVYSQSPASIVVDRSGWFSLENPQLVEPGMNNVPLVVNFVVETPSTIYNLNVSVNATYNQYFNYSYIHGPNRDVRNYYNIPEANPGENFSIIQLLNISPQTPTGYYQMYLDYSYETSTSSYNGTVPFIVPVLGYAEPVIANAFFGTKNNSIYATSFMNNVPITVIIENMGNSPAFNLSVNFTPSYPLSGFNQLVPISGIPQYSAIPVTFLVNIGNATEKIKQNLSITYNNGIKRNLTFSLFLAGYPSIKISQSYINLGNVAPSKGLNGVPLTLYIEDASVVPATNVTVVFHPKYPLAGAVQHINISAIPSYGILPLNFIVNITGSAYVANESINIYYNGSWKTLTFQVVISGAPKINLVTYYTEPMWVYENEQYVILKAIFVNSGNAFARNFNVTASSDMFNISQIQYHFPLVAPGQILNLTYVISTKNISGNYSIVLSTTFGNFSLYVNVLPAPVLNMTYSIPTVYPGSNKNLFVFKLTNYGPETIYGINIHLLTPDVFYIDVPSSNALGYLTADNITFGSLQPRHSLIITFIIDVRSSTSIGQYPSQLFISYRLNNSPYAFFEVYNFNVNVNYTGLQKVTSGYYLPEFIIAFALILIIAVSLVIIRKRKK